MNSRLISLFLCLTLLAGCFSRFYPTSSSKILETNFVLNVNTSLEYTSIQSAIDASETLSGHRLRVGGGTYPEHLTVNKSVTIEGEGKDTTVVDGGGTGVVIHITADNVIIKGVTVKKGLLGIHLDHSDNSVITDNDLSENAGNYALYASYSHNCTIGKNVVGPNQCAGILVTNTIGFNVYENYVFNNTGYGINANASTNGFITHNLAFNNSYDGVGLGENSSDCRIIGNTISNNGLFGVWVDAESVGNSFFDNNIIGNGKQASVNLANSWDNDFEGNYWSDYTGEDINMDGIGDSAYTIVEGNEDNYPLMGPFTVQETGLGIDVSVVSNSSIEGFSYSEFNGTLRMQVSNRTTNQTYGFCRIQIPHALMSEPYNVTVDNASPIFLNLSIRDDGANRWIYFTYEHSDREILIKAVPPLDIWPPIISIVSPESKSYTVATIELVFTINEPTTWMGFSLDSQGNVTINKNTTLNVASRGPHVVVVFARDLSGNTGSSSVYFVVDAEQAPFPTWILPALIVVIVLVVAVGILLYLRKKREINPPKGSSQEQRETNAG